MSTIYKIVDTTCITAKGGRADVWNAGNLKPAQRLFQPVPKDYPASIDQLATLKKYHLVGFEYGNWVSNNERIEYLYQTEASLLLLAKLLGTENLGLGKLHIAFGARGTGTALAHYEPQANAINLTKEHGKSSFAHEFGHALDYNIGGYLVQQQGVFALTGGSHKSPLGAVPRCPKPTSNKLRATVNYMVDRLAMDLDMHILKRVTPLLLKARAGQQLTAVEDFTIKEMLGARPYLAQRTEIFARAFEQYVCTELKLNGENFLTKDLQTYHSGGIYWKKEEFRKVIPCFNAIMRMAGNVLNGKPEGNYAHAESGYRRSEPYSLNPELKNSIPGLLDAFRWTDSRGLVIKPIPKNKTRLVAARLTHKSRQ